MNWKPRRWIVIAGSMAGALGAVALFQWCRGPNESRAEDRVAPPIVPASGPKIIPYDTQSKGSADPFRQRGMFDSAKPVAKKLPVTDHDAPRAAATDTDEAPRFSAPAERMTDTSARNPFQRPPSGATEAGSEVRLTAGEQNDPKTPWPPSAGSNTPPRPFPVSPQSDPDADAPKPLRRDTASPDAKPAWPVDSARPGAESPLRSSPFNAPVPGDAPARSPFNPPSTTGGNTNPPANGFGPSSPPAAAPARANGSAARGNPFNDAGTSPAPSASDSPAAPRTSTGVAPSGSEGTGRPGQKQLEGSQSPQLTLEKLAPREIQVGKPAVFEVRVKNVGTVAAQNVEIYDELPKGTQLLRTVPAASRGPRGELIWTLGVLKPNEESKVQMELMPVAEGEIGSVATLHFRADAGAKTICTKPEIALSVNSPRQVMIGEDVTFQLPISNPGSGVATGVVISEKVPSGLQHAAGSELEFEVGDLKPGESKQLDLTLKAIHPGPVTNVLLARADANLKVQERVELAIVSPGLKVGMTGPSKRYLERPASYTFSVSNPGTAAAKDVELTTYLPRGLKFVKANNSGSYDPRRHCVVWSLEELPSTEQGAVQMTALPIEEGEQKIRIEGKAQQGLTDSQESTIVVEGVAAIYFEVVDLNDPLEVGGETTYEIRVMNQGSKAASNLQLVAFLPPEMKTLAAEGPTKHAVEGSRVTFEPLARLAPKSDTTYRVRAQALKVGDVRMKVQVTTDEIRQPVTKEESTRVYADE